MYRYIQILAGIVAKFDDARIPVEPTAIIEPEPEFVPPPPVKKGLSTVGVWAGSSSLRNPERDVDFALKHNINRFDIIVNDHSAWRKPTDFNIRDASKIARLADTATAAGIEVHLMSWIMPHSVYIESAARELIPLAQGVKAKSIQWDAEEPWTQAKRPMPYKAAAALVGEVFRDRTFKMGVNGIGYAPVEKLGPLTEVCDYAVPQAYATKSSGLDPKDAPVRFYRRWRQKFTKPVVMGLAAYRQSGIPGYSPRQAVLTAVEATRKLEDVDTVLYWSLHHIRTAPEVAKAIATLLPADATP